MIKRLDFGVVAASVLLLSACGGGDDAAPDAAQDAEVSTAVEITPFAFETITSRNEAFDRSAYLYPDNHQQARQVNRNTGDIRLDGVVIDGVTYDQSQLQLVSGARIITDDAVDPVRGGANLATGYGIGADVDPWVEQGNATTTPTDDDIRAAHANFNLASLVAVREEIGTTVYELRFDRPTDNLLLWERGNSGGVLVEALDDAGTVRGSFMVLDRANDGGAASHYSPTGIVVTTYVLDDFLNHGQEFVSVGLRLSEPVRTLRFTAYEEPEGPGARRFNGPDLKVIGGPAPSSLTRINN